MTGNNICVCLKVINYSWGHIQVLFYFIRDVQHFPETLDVAHILSDPLIEKHQLSYLHKLSYCTLVNLLKTENIMLFFSPCVVFDCEITSLGWCNYIRSWSEERSVFLNSCWMPKTGTYQVWVRHLNVPCVSGWLEGQTTSWSTDITPHFTLCFVWTPRRVN